MSYHIRVTQDKEPYTDSYGNTRVDQKELYEQTVETLDLPALVIYINSQKEQKEK